MKNKEKIFIAILKEKKYYIYSQDILTYTHTPSNDDYEVKKKWTFTKQENIFYYFFN